MKKFLFADLDDTLFQTLGKCGDAQPLAPVAYYQDGSVCSYTTPAQRAFLALCEDNMTVIPTTARDLAALRRVRLPFSSYAIIDFGGIILTPEGEPDPYWHAQMRVHMHAALPGLTELATHIADYGKRTGYQGNVRLIEDCGTPFFLAIKDPDRQAERLATLEQELVRPWIADGQRDYTIHRNGNNLAILPRSLNKANAVAHVAQRLRAEHGEIVTFGMGDSSTDARFMAACDYAIVPRATQLARLTLEGL